MAKVTKSGRGKGLFHEYPFLKIKIEDFYHFCRISYSYTIVGYILSNYAACTYNHMFSYIYTCCYCSIGTDPRIISYFYRSGCYSLLVYGELNIIIAMV